jgi:thiol:disulfide interchange protein DsbD
MINFKMLMGFPMIGTALWLLSLAPDHFGDNGVFWVGMFLVCVSLAAWVYGQFIQAGTGSRAWSWGVIAAALVVGYWMILESQLQWRSPPPVKTAGSGPINSGGLSWSPWSPEAVAAARASGHPVLVDFTAKWCWTCRVNKAIAIEIPSVVERIKSLGMVTLRGDYTREDPAIADELRRFGRAGVPLVLVYPKNPTLPPQVLPEQLTEGIMLEALDSATNRQFAGP